MAPKQSLWADTAVYVQKSFRLNKALFHKVPNTLTFTEDDKKLFFLAGSGRSTLYSVDLEQEVDDIEEPLEHSQFFDTAYVHVSRKEELLRERQRICKNGITTFEYSNKTLLVPLGSNLYYHDMSDEKNEPNIIKESESASFFDTKLCPTDSRLISFIRNNDIFVTSSHVQEYVQLTHSPNSKEIYNGVPSFVVQEEFNRFTGYYWRPVQQGADCYDVLYELIDETRVPTIQLSAYQNNSIQTYKFPLAGEMNALASLKLVRFSLRPGSEAGPNISRYNLKEELHDTFPWIEYIPWFGWNPSGKSIWCMLLDRRQQKFSIIDIPLAYFTDHSASSQITTLYHRNCETWINVSDDIYFLQSSNNFKFIFKTEERFSHLYDITLTSDDKTEVQLTTGDWCVTSLVDVDEVHNVVYFHGLKVPTQQHLYKVKISEPGVVEQLTLSGYYHSCTMNNSRTAFVSVYSNINSHVQCGIFSTDTGVKLKTITTSMDFTMVYLKKTVCEDSKQSEDGSDSSPGEEVKKKEEVETGDEQGTSPQSTSSAISTYRYSAPILDNVTIDDEQIYYMIYPAKCGDLSKPLPVVLYVYGGPEVQLVTDRFRGIHHRQQNLFATLGYTVVIADCPGSANRGKPWAERLYKQMGTVEVEMQIKVLEELAKKYIYLDLSRVAIVGTSYGGYVSLMAIGQRPDFFKLAIAIAPATAWYLYDTAYSERYMGLLNENEDIYHETSSVMHYVNKFPSEEHRLLIIHGLMDENVHFTHSTTLISALIAAAKPYDLQVYPEERHGIGRGNAPGHCDTTIAVYLKNNL